MTKSKPKSKKVSESTRQLINIDSFDDFGITTLNNQQLVFLSIQPFNVAVIGSERVLECVKNLQTVLEDIGNIQIVCLSSAQSYEQNKLYLKERAKDPNMHPRVQQLCQQDIDFLDKISLTMSTSRSFYFVIRFNKRMEKDSIYQQLLQYQAIIKEQGFQVKKSSKNELQKALAIYWEQNTYLDKYPEFDGEQFLQEVTE